MKIWNEPSSTRADEELLDFEKVCFALQQPSCETIFTTILSFKCHTLGEISNFGKCAKMCFQYNIARKENLKSAQKSSFLHFFKQKERVRVY